jgi:hypothetical protein
MHPWFKILEAHKNGKFHMWFNGPSIRCIIGLSQIPIGNNFITAESAKYETEKIFNEMIQFKTNDMIVSLTRCCHLNDSIVVQLTGKGKYTPFDNYITFDDVWNRHGKEIIDGDYNITQEERKIAKLVL